MSVPNSTTVPQVIANHNNSHVIELRLQCQSPQAFVGLLKQQLSQTTQLLPILDVAAVTGRVSVELWTQLSRPPISERLVRIDLQGMGKSATGRD